MPLLLPFFLLVGAEIWTLIAVGSRLGAGTTLLLLLLAAIAGGLLIRTEGFAAARRINAAVASGESPASEMLGSLARLFAGLLLIFPGFLTDVLALAMLIPAVRHALVKVVLPGIGDLAGRRRDAQPEDTSPRGSAGRVIDGESSRIRD